MLVDKHQRNCASKRAEVWKVFAESSLQSLVRRWLDKASIHDIHVNKSEPVRESGSEVHFVRSSDERRWIETGFIWKA